MQEHGLLWQLARDNINNFSPMFSFSDVFIIHFSSFTLFIFFKKIYSFLHFFHIREYYEFVVSLFIDTVAVSFLVGQLMSLKNLVEIIDVNSTR